MLPYSIYLYIPSVDKERHDYYHYILMNITTTTSKSLDDMDAKELVEEAMKELQEIKRLLGINSKEEIKGDKV